MKFKISSKTIGGKNPTFIIAEAGLNHNGNLKTAKKLIQNAKNSGADAIKFQTFKAADLAISNSKFFQLFKKLEISNDQFGEISDFAKSNDIIFLSTPFSFNAVDTLYKLKIPAFKIASGDLTNLPLIRYASLKKKPIILSTGMSNLNEITDAINCIKNSKNTKFLITHSVSAYPTPLNETNLSVINSLKTKFACPVGYSDNGNYEFVSIIAVAMGANIIEKHFTLSKKMKGPDHALSSEPNQFASMVKKIREVEQMIGDGKKICQLSEIDNSIAARRSLHALDTLEKNSILSSEKVGIKRPATGILPKYFDNVIGKKTKKKILKDNPIKWKFLAK